MVIVQTKGALTDTVKQGLIKASQALSIEEDTASASPFFESPIKHLNLHVVERQDATGIAQAMSGCPCNVKAKIEMQLICV